MRGRVNAMTAEGLVAELRQRLAESDNVKAGTADGLTASSSLGGRALRLAQVAAAMHMTAAARSMAESAVTTPTRDGGVQ